MRHRPRYEGSNGGATARSVFARAAAGGVGVAFVFGTVSAASAGAQELPIDSDVRSLIEARAICTVDPASDIEVLYTVRTGPDGSDAPASTDGARNWRDLVHEYDVALTPVAGDPDAAADPLQLLPGRLVVEASTGTDPSPTVVAEDGPYDFSAGGVMAGSFVVPHDTVFPLSIRAIDGDLLEEGWSDQQRAVQIEAPVPCDQDTPVVPDLGETEVTDDQDTAVPASPPVEEPTSDPVEEPAPPAAEGLVTIGEAGDEAEVDPEVVDVEPVAADGENPEVLVETAEASPASVPPTAFAMAGIECAAGSVALDTNGDGVSDTCYDPTVVPGVDGNNQTFQPAPGMPVSPATPTAPGTPIPSSPQTGGTSSALADTGGAVETIAFAGFALLLLGIGLSLVSRPVARRDDLTTPDPHDERSPRTESLLTASEIEILEHSACENPLAEYASAVSTTGAEANLATCAESEAKLGHSDYTLHGPMQKGAPWRDERSLHGTHRSGSSVLAVRTRRSPDGPGSEWRDPSVQDVGIHCPPLRPGVEREQVSQQERSRIRRHRRHQASRPVGVPHSRRRPGRCAGVPPRAGVRARLSGDGPPLGDQRNRGLRLDPRPDRHRLHREDLGHRHRLAVPDR